MNTILRHDRSILPINTPKLSALLTFNANCQFTSPSKKNSSPTHEKPQRTGKTLSGVEVAKGKLSSSARPFGISKPTAKTVKTVKQKSAASTETPKVSTKDKDDSCMMLDDGMAESVVEGIEIEASTCTVLKNCMIATGTSTSPEAPRRKTKSAKSPRLAKTSLLVIAAKSQGKSSSSLLLGLLLHRTFIGVTKRRSSNATASLRPSSALAVLMRVATAVMGPPAEAGVEAMDLDGVAIPLKKEQKTKRLVERQEIDRDGDVAMSGRKASSLANSGALKSCGKGSTYPSNASTSLGLNSASIDTVMVDVRNPPGPKNPPTSGPTTALNGRRLTTTIIDIQMNDAPVVLDPKTHHKSPLGKLLVSDLLHQGTFIHKGTPPRARLGSQGDLAGGP